MLSGLRATAVVRAAVWLAAALSLSASAGLHPEPSHEGQRSRTQVAMDAGEALPGVDGGAHVCLVCLLHAPATGPVLPPAAAPAAATPLSATCDGARVSEAAPLRHDSRAPPILL